MQRTGTRCTAGDRASAAGAAAAAALRDALVPQIHARRRDARRASVHRAGRIHGVAVRRSTSDGASHGARAQWRHLSLAAGESDRRPHHGAARFGPRRRRGKADDICVRASKPRTTEALNRTACLEDERWRKLSTKCHRCQKLIWGLRPQTLTRSLTRLASSEKRLVKSRSARVARVASSRALSFVLRNRSGNHELERSTFAWLAIRPDSPRRHALDRDAVELVHNDRLKRG